MEDLDNQGVLVGHQHHHSPGNSTRRAYACSRSESIPSMSLLDIRGGDMGQDSLQGELRKIKPPSFDGENKKGEDAEAWLLGMRKYFQLHDYSSNVEARIASYHLQGKASMWWDGLSRLSTLMRREFLGSSSRNISSNSTCQSNIMTRRCKSSLNSNLGT
jgi:hypothetical protein